MSWDFQRDTKLRLLWSEGKTAKQIGVLMGVTRNAVIGRAHRLHLTGRPSPIKAGADGTIPRAKQPRNLRRGKAERDAAVARTEPVTAARNGAAVGNLKAVTIPAPRAIAPLRRTSSRGSCAWPIGDPREAGFHFCDAKPVMEGKPYCAEHCNRAYQRIAPPAESEAA